MYKTAFVVFAAVICSAVASAKPGVLAAYTAPIVAPAVVTAQSSQYFHRNHNGLVAPVVAAAPLVAAPIVKSAPLVAAPIVKAVPAVKTAPLVAQPVVETAPIVAKSAPVIAAAYSPFASPYYNPYVAASYFAHPAPVFV